MHEFSLIKPGFIEQGFQHGKFCASKIRTSLGTFQCMESPGQWLIQCCFFKSGICSSRYIKIQKQLLGGQQIARMGHRIGVDLPIYNAWLHSL